MLKKISKIMFFIILFIFIFSISYTCSASGSMSDADDFISIGSQKSPFEFLKIENLSNSLFTILVTLGTVIVVIVGIILGIQFVTGSVEQKAKVKETLIPFFVGSFVIFGAFGIWKLAVTILNQIN